MMAKKLYLRAAFPDSELAKKCFSELEIFLRGLEGCYIEYKRLKQKFGNVMDFLEYYTGLDTNPEQWARLPVYLIRGRYRVSLSGREIRLVLEAHHSSFVWELGDMLCHWLRLRGAEADFGDEKFPEFLEGWKHDFEMLAQSSEDPGCDSRWFSERLLRLYDRMRKSPVWDLLPEEEKARLLARVLKSG